MEKYAEGHFNRLERKRAFRVGAKAVEVQRGVESADSGRPKVCILSAAVKLC